MALNNSNADTVATAYCSANGITDPAAIQKWKNFCRMLYLGSSGSLLTAITATVPAMSIVTSGSAATQTGPAAPVPTVIS
jgi:hypothetical protein